MINRKTRTCLGAGATTAASLSVLVVAVTTPARGGTIRDDVGDSQYTALANDAKYSAVGRLDWTTSAGGFLGSGTLISSSWVLTAAHCVDDPAATNVRFGFGGSTYAASRWSAHSSWAGNLGAGYDIGLVKLSAPVSNVAPAARFTGTNELGLVGTSVGYGRTGTGLTGDTLGAGTRRAGTNTLDALGNKLGSSYSNNIVIADFDSPGSTSYNRSWSPSAAPLALEYAIAPGDSGGGLFVDAGGGRARLAGVHSFSHAIDGTVNSSYGDTYGSIRVNQFNQWIDDLIAVQWSNTAGGTFAAPANWSGGTAPVSADVVGFKSAGTYTVNVAAGTVSDRALVRGGQVTLNLAGPTGYSLTSTSAEGSLTVGKYAGENAGLTVTGGTLSTRDAVIAELPSSTGRVTTSTGGTWNAAGSVHVGGGATAAGGTGTLTVDAGSSARVDAALQVWGPGRVNYNGGSLSVGQLALVGGGDAVLSAGGNKVLRAGSVSVDSGAGSRLDLADNDMIVDYAGASPADAVRQYLLAGYGNGAWDGNGIASSVAAADAQDRTAVGYAEASALGLGSYLGQGLDATSLLLKYTWYGDANLDGRVDADDYARIDRGFARSLTGWLNGDFNYDNAVTSADYLLIDRVATLQSGVLAPELLSERAGQFGDAYVAALVAAVPEPGTLGLLVAAVPLIARRHRRRAA